MTGVFSNGTSQDDEIDECKAELPHVIASVLAQRSDTVRTVSALSEREALIAR